ncbi:hypothetical protein GCK72_020474 [Caenorhabditis remanei]|uniref:ShKT domain-containing protein n=1 Tax=Caenorhabditis remanei TaxID=31234 RepID=A0A6A5GFA4_CAERE|nr:hypothetical protein GCK72_020474 [Caenorhabditis remanei]KAF1753917.1 hypothetical protein GCK72_020474 [Caenorhabditis remanei]
MNFFLASLSIFMEIALAAIVDDFSCTVNGVYTSSATACANTISDQACAVFYPESSPNAGFPLPGNSVQRPYKCYSVNANGGAVSADMKKAAISNCAKTCGMCCLTPAYNCPNAPFPSMDCNSITASQCSSPIWRELIAKNCPAACGFCNDGGCVDGVTDCANDITICTNVVMQDFVNQYCKKTCGRCNGSNPSKPTCTKYPGDSASACAAWAANGYCTNSFYTDETRRRYCATTCKIC